MRLNTPIIGGGTTSLLLLTAVTLTNAQITLNPLNKSVLVDNLSRRSLLLTHYQAAFDNPLVLPSAPVTTQTPYPVFNLPTACIAEGKRMGCLPYQLRAYAVQYSDCPTPWHICHCTGSAGTHLSLDKMIHLFGQVPVAARSHVRTFHSLPEFYGRVAAYAVQGDIAATSDFREGLVTMVHELIHVLDNSGSVTSREWSQAIRDDTCVITEYALNNVVENYAELGTLLFLSIVDPEGFQRLEKGLAEAGKSLKCLENQWEYVKKSLTRLMTPERGSRCGSRVNPSSRVVWTVPRLETALERFKSGGRGRVQAAAAAGTEEDEYTAPPDSEVIWDFLG